MRIVEEMHNRYGDRKYDSKYIGWGFDDLDTQIVMAEKLQGLFPPDSNKILDIACGISRYHRVWLKSGYDVTGVDISDTFIEYSRDYNKDFLNARYYVRSFNDLDFHNEFDVVTWMDPVDLTGLPVRNVFISLKPGGLFIYEMWNDNYYEYHTDNRHNDCRTWSCKDGVYHLVRHAYNRATCAAEHEEIIFDLPNDTMIHKTGLNLRTVNNHCSVQIVEAAGFRNVGFIDYDGQPFSTENQMIKRFFLVGVK